MNVCLVSREYPPFFGGGIGAYAVRWSRALARCGHRVVVVTVSDDGRESREREDGVEVVRLPFIKGSGHTGDWTSPHPKISTPVTRAAFATFSPVAVFAMQIAEALQRLVEEFGIDVVEFPETGGLGWFVLNARRNGALWSNGSGPAVVTVLHSPTQWIAEWNRAPLQGRRDLELAWMERECAEWADATVSPSHGLAAWAAKEWGLGCVEVIPYPLGELEAVARERAAPGRRTDEGGPGIQRRVLFAGRLEPRKGIDTLLDGFERAIAAGADLRLALAGEDMWDPTTKRPFGETLLAQLSPEARDRVRSLGRVGPTELAALRDAADIVVVPSPMDNFPNTCMEAMAHGCVVVAARAGGMAEMIGDGQGVLFSAADAEACAVALREAAGMDPRCAAAMGRDAAGRMLQMCGNEGVVSRRVAHFGQVLGERKQNRKDARSKNWLTVNRAGMGESQLQRLKLAAIESNASFAHGWAHQPDGTVAVFGTPRADTLAIATLEPGTLVMAEEAANDARVAALLRGNGVKDERTAASTREVAMALIGAGHTGALVPDVLAGTVVEARPAVPSAISAGEERPPVVVRAEGLGKMFKIYTRPIDRLREWLRIGGKRHTDFWAVRGVNFEVRRGECLGIIGANGSGKSTLLKMITGALYPTEGSYRVEGRVLSLIELGTGLNMNLSGRENIAHAAALLGFPANFARQKTSEIEEFADLGEFFDRQVGVYSTGMRVRLAFSMFACFKPEVLIVDEALSVGDVFFQQKCAARIRELLDGGMTMIFVSHDQSAVMNLCDQAVLLDHGKVTFQGLPSEAVHRYSAALQQRPKYGPRRVAPPDAKPSPEPGPLPPPSASPVFDVNAILIHDVIKERSAERFGNGDMRIVAARVTDRNNRNSLKTMMGGILNFEVLIEAARAVHLPRAGINLFDRFNNLVFAAGSYQSGRELPDLEPGERVVVRFELTLDVQPGEYTFGLGASLPSEQNPEHGVVCDKITHLGPVVVLQDRSLVRPFYGIARLPMTVEVEQVKSVQPT